MHIGKQDFFIIWILIKKYPHINNFYRWQKTNWKIQRYIRHMVCISKIDISILKTKPIADIYKINLIKIIMTFYDMIWIIL